MTLRGTAHRAPGSRRTVLRALAGLAALALAGHQGSAPLAAARLTALHDSDTLHPHAFAHGAFTRVWRRTDEPVAGGTVSRTWLWGPAPITDGRWEEYVESHGGARLVQYFHKSRMEVTHRFSDQANPFYVTNGLLVIELMTGAVRLGDALTLQRSPSTLVVAGDQRPFPTSPTYAGLARVRSAEPLPVGAEVRQVIDAAGTVSPGGPGGVTAATLVEQTNHTIASVFWSFLNAEGLIRRDDTLAMERLFEPLFYATGYPVTEPYWALVLVNGRPAQVLIQAFERRVLTYTPANPPGFQVESGNVGEHYLRWRYPR